MVVLEFLTEYQDDTSELQKAISIPLVQRTDILYLQWIAEAKGKVEDVLYKDLNATLLPHACLRHLEVFVLYLFYDNFFYYRHGFMRYE